MYEYLGGLHRSKDYSDFTVALINAPIWLGQGIHPPLLPKQSTQNFASYSVAVAHRLYMHNSFPHKSRIPGRNGYLYPSNLQGIHTKNRCSPFYIILEGNYYGRFNHNNNNNQNVLTEYFTLHASWVFNNTCSYTWLPNS